MDPQRRRAWELFPVLCMAWLFYALDGAVISVMITNADFKRTFALDDSRLGLYVLLPAIGALVSTVGFGAVIPKYTGRKWGFQIATCFVVFGVILQTFPDKWEALCTGRFLMGFGGDLNGMVLGWYVTEASPKNVRGRSLILVQQFSSSFFAIVGYWAAYGIAFLDQEKAYSWKVANSLQFAPAIVFFLLVFKLVESPRWLAAKYPDDDMPMLRSLAWLRGKEVDHPDLIAEGREIRDYEIWSREHEATNPLNIFMEKRLTKRWLYAMVPLLQQQFCGVGLLGLYASIIFQQLGLNTQKNALLLNACLQILYAIAALASSYFVERLGRRTCILTASVIQSASLACICGLAVGTEKSPSTVANAFIVVCIVVNTTVYWLLGTGPTVVYINEIFPNHVREIGVGAANAIPIGVAVALGQQWPSATTKLGPRSYFILLGTCTLGTILCWFFVKEPKGLSIERIDVLFGEQDKVEVMEAKFSEARAAKEEHAPATEMVENHKQEY
ncbi:MFS sugar transporter [Fusarium pseudocircinatum]|uniref:MFS sugar transporter n=1 Tax=Fusarium pseudocircinatum TaxID=56676 RepID=A0A8H5KHE4_9HYPO|nr:MFS sugar transporter [Fusarium pseudocircinatum]